jgi:hypothetical protein
MSARIPMRWRVLGGAAIALAVLGTTGCDDSAKVKELQEKTAAQDKKIAALEARLKDLEDKQPVQYSKPEKDDEYVSAVAGAALDALLAGDVSGLRNNLSATLRQAIDARVQVDIFGNRSDEVATWVTSWNPGRQYKTYTIEKVVLSPTKDEAVIQGTLTPKEDSNKKGSFSLTLVKDKEKNKFLIDASSAKP